MGRGRIRQAQRAAQPLHGELDDARRQRPATLADEQRSPGRQRHRAEVEIGGDGVAHRRDYRHRAGLAALAEHGERINGPGGRLFAGERECFRDTQSRAVEQGEDGGIAGQDPLRAGLAVARLGARDFAGGGCRERLGQGAGDLGRSHGGQGGSLALAGAFQMAREGTHTGKAAQQGAALDARRAPPCHEGTNITGQQGGKVGNGWRAAQMFGEKGDELPQIATVGLQSVGGGAPLAGEMGEPALGFRRQVWPGGRKYEVHAVGAGFAGLDGRHGISMAQSR